VALLGQEAVDKELLLLCGPQALPGQRRRLGEGAAEAQVCLEALTGVD